MLLLRAPNIETATERGMIQATEGITRSAQVTATATARKQSISGSVGTTFWITDRLNRNET